MEAPRWMGGRVVEGARLESAYRSKAYRGFESHLIRQFRSGSHHYAAFRSGTPNSFSVILTEPNRLKADRNVLFLFFTS